MPTNNLKRYRTFNGMINYDYFRKNENGKIENTLSETDFKELVISKIAKENSIDWFCLVAHNRDILDEESGTLKPHHIHFVLRFENARTINSVLNSLSKVKISERNISAAQSVASSLLYLTHTTPQAIKEKKTRYEVSELSIFAENHFLNQSEKELWYRNKISGSLGQISKKFDETPLIIDIYKEIQQGFIPTDNNLLNLIKSYRSLYQLSEEEILVFVRKNRKQFQMDRESYIQDYVRTKKSQGKVHNLFYINGSGGIGKSIFSKSLSEKLISLKYSTQDKQDLLFESSSSGKNSDLLNQYELQPISIFDDLNINSFSNTQHFLKLFEKNIVPLIQSRYQNKYFLSEYSFITKSEPIKTFISSIYRLNGVHSEINLKQQILRRFSLIIEIETDKLILKEIKRKPNTTEFEIVISEVIQFDNLTFIELFSSYDTDNTQFKKLHKQREKIIEKIVNEYL
ncbi:Rep family protein [Lactococcus allomyrinae]|uniref:Uncharacterized protein n=1 Tax=Lactococcus allomyrinae TaxID=2419773 RepID=A0A387BIT1_9LACT|nr:Rep family protein [Lactococcus allomyrinae]AYG02074.1 hypothetical protein D7I46_13140 [Lactococcus allomyrinae]